MEDNIILFSLPLLKKIEPLLKECYGFERPMLSHGLLTVYSAYAENYGQFSKKEEETFLLEPPIHKPLSDLRKPSTSHTIDLDAQYECAFNVGNKMLLNLGSYTIDDIAELVDKYLEESTTTKKDIDILFCLILMAGVYYKHQWTNGLFDFRDFLVNDMQMNYTYRVRPDFLKLYEMFHSEKKIKSNSIRIEYNNEVINLENFDNWFLNMVTPYLDKYLGVKSLEEVQTELQHDYPDKKQKGRKKVNNIADIMLMGTYNIIQYSSMAEEGKSLTNKQAEFLLDYLKYLGVIEPDSNKDDTLNLRATINNLKKYTLDFNWWSIPMRKESPNNPFDGTISKAW